MTRDQERLIDVEHGGALSGLMDYVEGSVVLAGQQGIKATWRSSPSLFSDADVAKLAEDAGGVLYCLEGALYYGGEAGGESDVDKVLRDLSVRPGARRVALAKCWQSTKVIGPTE
jgi:cytokinin dehydrogenase